MKGILITTQNEVSIQEYGDPLYQTVGKSVGGFIEHVKPRGLRPPYCLIINEEGRLKNLPWNKYGCFLYGTITHGHPIVGDIVLMKDGFRDGEPDIVGLDDKEAETLVSEIRALIDSAQAMMQ